MSKDSLIDNLLGIPSIQIGRNPLLVDGVRASIWLRIDAGHHGLILERAVTASAPAQLHIHWTSYSIGARASAANPDSRQKIPACSAVLRAGKAGQRPQ
jgi:hypothetical protein